MFEVRDSMTCISAIAVQLEPTNEQERWLAGRAGYGITRESQMKYVLFGHLDPASLTSDPYKQKDNTMRVAHQYVRDYWDVLESGEVVDVQFLRGEHTEPCGTDRQMFE